MFNIWPNLASWVMFEMSFPSPTTRQYVEQMKKVGILSHDWNLQLVDPTMQYVQRMKKVDMWSFFVCLFLKFIPPGPNQAIYIHSGPYKTQRSTSSSMNKPSRAMFNRSFPYLCKPIRWIYEQSRNVTSSLYFELLSFPWKTIPRTNQRMGFRHLQFRDPTLQYLEHVIIVGILGHCYDFFPFLLPCTNRYIQHMTQLGILGHFWNIPPSTFQYVEQMK